MIFILMACSLKKSLAGNLDPTEFRGLSEDSLLMQRTVKSALNCDIKQAVDLFLPFFSSIVLRAIWKWLFSTWADLRANVFFRGKKKKIHSNNMHSVRLTALSTP